MPRRRTRPWMREQGQKITTFDLVIRKWTRGKVNAFATDPILTRKSPFWSLGFYLFLCTGVRFCAQKSTAKYSDNFKWSWTLMRGWTEKKSSRWRLTGTMSTMKFKKNERGEKNSHFSSSLTVKNGWGARNSALLERRNWLARLPSISRLDSVTGNWWMVWLIATLLDKAIKEESRKAAAVERGTA